MKAAVLRAIGAPLTIEDVAIAKPGPHEVLIRTVASGVCHSDLSIIEGKVFSPSPVVLGHESAGVVEAIGDSVRAVQVGDHVVTCMSAFCGRCDDCLTGHTSVCEKGDIHRGRAEEPRLVPADASVRRFHQGAGLGGFAEYMLVNERTCVAIRRDMPLDRAALIGCAVVTGVGAVAHTAKVELGSTVAVIGCGGVGLSVINGAAIAGAARIIAIDRVESKCDIAFEMGATDFVDASKVDAVEAVREMTGGGVRYSFEAIGLKPTVEQAFAMLRHGGVATMVGVPPMGTKIELDSFTLLAERRLQGSMLGSNHFPLDIPRYIDLYMQGRLKLDTLISRRLPLDEINSAFDELRTGQVARSVIMFEP